MLLNFDTELDRRGVTRMVGDSIKRVTPEATKSRSLNRSYLMKSEWDWKDLRDYVVYEIQERFGVQERESYKEIGIFKGFMKRWGADAPAIARYAFDVEHGRWRGKPITVTQFCKGSDPYFAAPIMERLRPRAS